MPLIPLRPLLETVDKYHFAQGAFNVNAVAQAKAAIEVHEMFRSAAILQGADLANGFMGGRTDFQNATLEDKKVGAKNIADAVKKYAENSPIPVVLHLDHGMHTGHFRCHGFTENRSGVWQEISRDKRHSISKANQFIPTALNWLALQFSALKSRFNMFSSQFCRTFFQCVR